jgi:hypothetical protein
MEEHYVNTAEEPLHVVIMLRRRILTPEKVDLQHKGNFWGSRGFAGLHFFTGFQLTRRFLVEVEFSLTQVNRHKS